MSRSTATAGTTRRSGNGGATMWVTGLNTGASFGVAGKSCSTQIITSEIAMYAAAALVAGHWSRQARAVATRIRGNAPAATL